MIVLASRNGAAALPEAMRILRRGGWPNILGTVQVDASIMDGTTLRAGTVGAARGTSIHVRAGHPAPGRRPGGGR